MATVLPFTATAITQSTRSPQSDRTEAPIDEARFQRDLQILRIHRPAVVSVLATQTHLFAQKVRAALSLPLAGGSAPGVDLSPATRRATTIARMRAAGARLCVAYLEQEGAET